jgi:hypothetical protein
MDEPRRRLVRSAELGTSCELANGAEKDGGASNVASLACSGELGRELELRWILGGADGSSRCVAPVTGEEGCEASEPLSRIALLRLNGSSLKGVNGVLGEEASPLRRPVDELMVCKAGRSGMGKFNPPRVADPTTATSSSSSPMEN